MALNEGVLAVFVSTGPHLGENQEEKPKECGSKFVIPETSSFKQLWDLITVIMLFYVATALPYNLCFMDFAIPMPIDKSEYWTVTEQVFDVLFWFDLFITFFIGYSDESGKEVRSLDKIAVRYFRGFFFINLIACLPPAALRPVLDLSAKMANEQAGIQSSLRLARLQRISRLVRLTRLSKLVSFMKSNRHWLYFQSLRGVRVINFLAFFCLVVHLGACGWYLVAALHERPEGTWVGRRGLIEQDDGGQIIAVETPLVQWLTACYFMMTVITTVGFGDMSAITEGEVLFVCVAMLVGSIVNSIILSEVITVLQSVDAKARAVEDQKQLCQDFAEHVHLSFGLSNELKAWAATKQNAYGRFDRQAMKDLVLSNYIPRELTGQMPNNMFEGKLAKNSFISMCKGPLHRTIPPRFPLLVALAVKERCFECGEFVYFFGDYAFNIFLVVRGVFANIAKPTEHGGFVNLLPTAFDASATMHQTHSQAAKAEVLSPYQVFGPGSYFGDAELILEQYIPRKSGVRCETANGGTLLGLHKDELFELMTEFPVFAGEWRHLALRREAARQRMLNELREHTDYRALAATILQRYIRPKLLCNSKSTLDSNTMPILEFRDRVGTTSQPLKLRGLTSRMVPPYAKQMTDDLAKVRADVSDLKSLMETHIKGLRENVHELQEATPDYVETL